MTFSIDQFRIDGKVAVVTGAGGRGNSIGRAYALGLAGAGAAVVVADLNGEGAGAVAEEIGRLGGRAIAAQVDITQPDAVRPNAQAAHEAIGGLDKQVNNPPLMVELGYQPATDVPIEEWNRLIAVNVTGALNCAQALVPQMRARGGGRIVYQLSGGAFPAQSLYGVSKLALLGLTTTLARQLGPEGINVNAIAPGNVMSDAGKMLTPDESPFIKLLEATVFARVRGQPDDLVGALLLLCSDAGAWITGQTLHVDGGWVVRP
jgi:NAD(P)-dependent dehydrogenase (short-subunit alcohol dehydrogenase family)